MLCKQWWLCSQYCLTDENDAFHTPPNAMVAEPVMRHRFSRTRLAAEYYRSQALRYKWQLAIACLEGADEFMMQIYDFIADAKRDQPQTAEFQLLLI